MEGGCHPPSTTVYRLVCGLVPGDHAGSPLRYHIENYDVSCRWMLTVSTTVYRLVCGLYRATTRGRPYGTIVYSVVWWRVDANRLYNGLSFGIRTRTGRPCGSGATVSHPHCGQTQPSCTTEPRHKSRADGLRPFGPHPHLRHHRASPPTYTAQPVGCVAQPTLKSEKFRSNCCSSKVGVSKKM